MICSWHSKLAKIGLEPFWQSLIAVCSKTVVWNQFSPLTVTFRERRGVNSCACASGAERLGVKRRRHGPHRMYLHHCIQATCAWQHVTESYPLEFDSPAALVHPAFTAAEIEPRVFFYVGYGGCMLASCCSNAWTFYQLQRCRYSTSRKTVACICNCWRFLTITTFILFGSRGVARNLV